MDQYTAIDLQDREKLITAATWRSSFESELGVDSMYDSFIKVMLYRRDIANRLLKTHDEIEEKSLKQIYEDCNKQIAQILGI